MSEQQRFARNLRNFFGCVISLGVMTAFMFDWIVPASPKELSVAVSLSLAWLFLGEWEPKP
jgi:hypothetical protein